MRPRSSGPGYLRSSAASWGLSPAPSALKDTCGAHLVAQGASGYPAVGSHPVPAAPAGYAVHLASGGDPPQGVPGLAPAGRLQLGGVEVGQADLHPVGAPPGSDGDAEGIPVPYMHHRA